MAVVKLKLPVPEAARPMSGFEFVQWKVEPEVPEKVTFNVVPPQTVLSAGSFMVGRGFATMVLLDVLAQLDALVTVTV